MIVTLPTFGAIRNHFPNAKIEVMGYPSFLEIIRGRFYADEVSRFDHADVSYLFMKEAKVPASLRKRFTDIDLIISFVSDKDQILTGNLNAMGARCVMHHDPFPPEDGSVHVIDHFLKSLDTLDISCTNKVPKIFLHDEDIRFGNDFVREKNVDPEKISVVLHPGSGSRQKCWPVERFAALANWLTREIQAHVFLVSGPADGEILEELRANVKDKFFMIEHLPLPKLASVIKRCDLFIGNDSGVTHLAAAMGVHTVAIFGPTDPKIWGPWGDRVKILYKKTYCSPCPQEIRRDCSVRTCLENIKIEDVLHEIEDALL